MKSFNAIFFIFLFTIVSFQAEAQLQFGIQVGVNNGKTYFKNNPEDNLTAITRLRIGLTTDYTINEKFNLQTSFLLTSKGWKGSSYREDIFSSTSKRIFDNKTTTVYTYLEVPIHLVYKMNNFQFYGGTYLGFGLTGYSKQDYKLVEIENGKADVIEFTSIPSLKPTYGKTSFANSNSLDTREPFNGFDYGLDLGLGYKLGRFLLNGGYSLGLGNIAPNIENKEFRKQRLSQHRNFTVSLSYFFGKKTK